MFANKTILTDKRNATIKLRQDRHVINKHELHDLYMTRTLSKVSGLFEFIDFCLSIMLTDPRGGGGGGTLIFSYIGRLGQFFWVPNFEFQYFFLVFRKMNIFWGMKILWIFFWSSQNWTIFKGHFYAFYVFFSKCQGTERRICFLIK